MTTRFSPLALLAVSGLTAACSFQLGSATAGLDGKVQFSYASDLFGSADSKPMMLGTTERLAAQGKALPAVTFVSSDASIVSVSSQDVSCCSTSSSGSSCDSPPAGGTCPAGSTESVTVDVIAQRAGSARISLVDASGKEVDATVLSVAAPAKISLSCSQSAQANVTVGKSCVPAWSASDSAGHDLQASKGVRLTSSDPNVVGFEAFLGSVQGSVDGDQGFLGTSLVGVAPGDAVVTGTAAGGVSAAMSAHVTK